MTSSSTSEESTNLEEHCNAEIVHGGQHIKCSRSNSKHKGYHWHKGTCTFW